MPAKLVRSTRLPDEPLAKFVPLVPLLVVASYKGGVWKTSLTVAIAERLAWAGLRVLLITSDTQEDARARLGVKRSEPLVTSRAYGDAGTVTVAGFRGSTVIDLLYRVGPGKLGIGTFDIVVLDTPPEVQGGSLPGVLLVCPMDGMDAVRNLLTMLGRTPDNTDIVLVQVLRKTTAEEWAENAESIEQALGRTVHFLDEPLPNSDAIAEAHDEGRSVWNLRRTGKTKTFLSGVDTLAHMAWERLGRRQNWLLMPPSAQAIPYVPGWDDEEN